MDIMGLPWDLFPQTFGDPKMSDGGPKKPLFKQMGHPPLLTLQSTKSGLKDLNIMQRGEEDISQNVWKQYNTHLYWTYFLFFENKEWILFCCAFSGKQKDDHARVS